MVNSVARPTVNRININEVYVKSRYMSAVALFVSITSGLCQVAIPQTIRDPSVSATPPSDSTRSQVFMPGLDDLMTMLIQPRHVKLYYAGSHNNWEVAGNEARDLRSAFLRVGQLIPRYLGNDLPQALLTIIVPKMQAVDVAIAAGDPKQFNRAYNDLTAACNACHGYMEHGFLVIKVPESAANTLYPDQDFIPAR